MDRLRIPPLTARLWYLVIAVLLIRTTFTESNQSAAQTVTESDQSAAQTVTESVIPISSTHVSFGTSSELDLLEDKSVTRLRNTTQKPIVSTSHEVSPLHGSTVLSILPSVDNITKMTHLDAPSSPVLTSVVMQSSSHMIDNVYTDTGRTVYVKTSTESPSNTTTVSSPRMNSSITHGSVPEFQERSTSFGIMSTMTRIESFASYSVRQESEMVKSTLRFSPETGPENTNTEFSVDRHNLATGLYETQSQTSKASDITETNEFIGERIIRPSIISVLGSSFTATSFVPTEKASSISSSSSSSYSSFATTTVSTQTLDEPGGQDSHGDMGISSISTEVITEVKTNPQLHSSLEQKVGTYLGLDENTVISTSQAQIRSTPISNHEHDIAPVSSVDVDTRPAKLFSPYTSLQPSPTVYAVNKYATTTAVTLPPIEERNDEQHLINEVSRPSTQTQNRPSNETITDSSTSISGSKDSSSRSSIPLDTSHPYRNQTRLTTPKKKVLPTSAGAALTSSLADHSRTNAEFALTTGVITSQSGLIPADERETDRTASSVQQVDRLPHLTHEETVNQPCASIGTWKTTSDELESTSTDSLLKPLKYDLRFAITFQGDCEAMMDDSKSQLQFWESIIYFICNTLNLPDNTVQPEDINCPPLRVYFTLKQISRTDAFEVLNNTISNNSFQVQILADSVPIIYKSQFIQRLEPTSDRPDRSVTTLERLDIIIISIAAVLFFVLLVACSCICCREIYKRKHVQSFQLKETPHVSVKVEDYTLTRIPRTKVNYTDSHVLTEEDLGVNHQQIESKSKENGDHHLNVSGSTADIDTYQNESDLTVKGDHAQNESSSNINLDPCLEESKLKDTGDCHHQNESGSKVCEDPVEGKGNKINQDSIRIKFSSHADGIVIGVTCSPPQISKVTKPLSDCLAPTEKNLSGESSESLIEKSEGEEGMSNPNCRVDDERYAGHTSPEEDEELL
ncbi:hypothetical protein ACJMK2_032567 [Sinanodonta woodiana]|uniref:Uncharacterized protein n=1 Tax=Sinanodonta woodiana TaxID=1069815 RepID=A0ABD3X250_SINWO